MHIPDRQRGLTGLTTLTGSRTIEVSDRWERETERTCRKGSEGHPGRHSKTKHTSACIISRIKVFFPRFESLAFGLAFLGRFLEHIAEIGQRAGTTSTASEIACYFNVEMNSVAKVFDVPLFFFHLKSMWRFRFMWMTRTVPILK